MLTPLFTLLWTVLMFRFFGEVDVAVAFLMFFFWKWCCCCFLKKLLILHLVKHLLSLFWAISPDLQIFSRFTDLAQKYRVYSFCWHKIIFFTSFSLLLATKTFSNLIFFHKFFLINFSLFLLNSKHVRSPRALNYEFMENLWHVVLHFIMLPYILKTWQALSNILFPTKK